MIHDYIKCRRPRGLKAEMSSYGWFRPCMISFVASNSHFKGQHFTIRLWSHVGGRFTSLLQLQKRQDFHQRKRLHLASSRSGIEDPFSCRLSLLVKSLIAVFIGDLGSLKRSKCLVKIFLTKSLSVPCLVIFLSAILMVLFARNFYAISELFLPMSNFDFW